MAVGQEPPPLTDLQNLDDSIRAECISDTAVLCDYREDRLLLGLPPDYESFAAAKKMARLRDSGADQLDIARFLTLGAKRNTLRAFA